MPERQHARLSVATQLSLVRRYAGGDFEGATGNQQLTWPHDHILRNGKRLNRAYWLRDGDPGRTRPCWPDARTVSICIRPKVGLLFVVVLSDGTLTTAGGIHKIRTLNLTGS